MISHRQISAYIAAEPFRPFRITLSSGRAFDIRHPEMVSVGRNTLFIHLYMADDAQEYTERVVQVSLLLTESVEPLPLASATSQGTS